MRGLDRRVGTLEARLKPLPPAAYELWRDVPRALSFEEIELGQAALDRLRRRPGRRGQGRGSNDDGAGRGRPRAPWRPARAGAVRVSAAGDPDLQPPSKANVVMRTLSVAEQEAAYGYTHVPPIPKAVDAFNTTVETELRQKSGLVQASLSEAATAADRLALERARLDHDPAVAVPQAAKILGRRRKRRACRLLFA